jgi:hypothetical protein
VSLDQCLSDLRQFFRKEILELDLAESEEIGLKHRAAIKTPARVGEQLNQRAFFLANRIEALDESLAMSFVCGGIFAR